MFFRLSCKNGIASDFTIQLTPKKNNAIASIIHVRLYGAQAKKFKKNNKKEPIIPIPHIL